MAGLLGEGVLRTAGLGGGIRRGRWVPGDDGHSRSPGQVRPEEQEGLISAVSSSEDGECC